MDGPGGRTGRKDRADGPGGRTGRKDGPGGRTGRKTDRAEGPGGQFEACVVLSGFVLPRKLKLPGLCFRESARQGPGPDRLGLKCYLAWGGNQGGGGGEKGGACFISFPRKTHKCTFFSYKYVLLYF